MPFQLLTGASGLVGQYLMRDALLANIPTAVLVRPAGRLSSRQRVERILTRWERELGHVLPRPVVIEGDLGSKNLGISQADWNWLSTQCDTVIHSAASIKFNADEVTGEPYRTNTQGTRELIEVCRAANIRKIHLISTAYVCGTRSDRVFENEESVNPEFGNDYEKSKALSEQLVRSADCFDQITIIRPSIVVGDSKSGYTSTFHGFYAPLQLGWIIDQQVKQANNSDWLSGLSFIEQLGLNPEDRKNMVPVDWVSAITIRIVKNPALHGQVFHLTNPCPVQADVLERAITDAIAECSAKQVVKPQFGRNPSGNGPANLESFDEQSIEKQLKSFRSQMKIYNSYLRNDPEFDSSNTAEAIPDLPCPNLDLKMMTRLAKFAIKDNFGAKQRAQVAAKPSEDLHELFRQVFRNHDNELEVCPAAGLSLQVNGPGGGKWQFVFEEKSITFGLPAERFEDHQFEEKEVFLSSATFARIRAGELNVVQAIYSGLLFVFAPVGKFEYILFQLEMLFDHISNPTCTSPNRIFSPARN